MSISRPIYKVQRGEPITIGREVLSGDPAGYTVSALLKPTLGQTIPAASVAPVAEFEVTFEPAAGETRARWLLTVPGLVTADLAPGHFVVDARFALDGETVEITEPAFITLVESVSG